MSRVRGKSFVKMAKNRRKKKEGKRNCFEIKVIREKAIISVFTRETMEESKIGKPRRGVHEERMKYLGGEG